MPGHEISEREGNKSPQKVNAGAAQSKNKTPAKDPVLNRARVIFDTDNDNKDHDTGVYVYVQSNDRTVQLARIENADNSSRDATEYNDFSRHSLDLTVLSNSKKSACQNFRFKIGSRAHGNDKWKLRNARVELYFTDGTNIARETNAFELNSRGSRYTEREF